MNADGTQMHADAMNAKRESGSSSMEMCALAWSQEPRPLRLSRAWKRRLSAFMGAFRSLLWNWS